MDRFGITNQPVNSEHVNDSIMYPWLACEGQRLQGVK